MNNFIRAFARKNDQLRDISFDLKFIKNSDGSCLVKYGNTHVICTATIEDRTPLFLRGKGSGWVTAEYAMLPRSSQIRIHRESHKGISGRTHEIQRLLGRALRSVVDLKILGERQIVIDCDVLNADGGTRTAAITGGYIALYQACQRLHQKRMIREMPINRVLAAVSCGIVNDLTLLDLEYREDSIANVDANFIMTDDNKIVEIQAAAEHKTFTEEEFRRMCDMARNGLYKIFELQKQVLKID